MVKLDRRVVDFVATHPYLITSRTMRDDEDFTPIMHRYFGKYAIYNGKKRENRKKIDNQTQ